LSDDEVISAATHEGWISFIETCGEILSEIKNTLIHLEPLQSRIYDWQVTQFDIGYDIPFSNINNQNKSFKKGSLKLTRLFDGCIKVKHLDRVYQIYNKQLPTKGSCLHIEEHAVFHLL
jgi:hypothetical protein